MIEPSIFIVLSLAVLSSMMFNPRRLEAIGYSLCVLFLQVLIADVFLVCPQFPIYVSLQDTNINPHNTLPDSRARGVYVDTALLLPCCTRLRTDTAASITDAFRNAYQEHFQSIVSELGKAYTQVLTKLTQAEILLSSPRFFDQDKVILLATAGEYHRIGATMLFWMCQAVLTSKNSSSPRHLIWEMMPRISVGRLLSV